MIKLLIMKTAKDFSIDCLSLMSDNNFLVQSNYFKSDIFSHKQLPILKINAIRINMLAWIAIIDWFTANDHLRCNVMSFQIAIYIVNDQQFSIHWKKMKQPFWRVWLCLRESTA